MQALFLFFRNFFILCFWELFFPDLSALQESYLLLYFGYFYMYRCTPAQQKIFSDRTKAHLTYLYQTLSTKPSLQDQPISTYIASDSDTISDKIKCKLVGIRHICKDSQLRHLLHGTLSYLRLTHKIFL